jgi:hypothetical protein
MKKIICLTPLALLLCSCASVNVSTLKSAPPKGEGCYLDVYYSKSEIKHSYESVCSIASETASNLFADRTVQGAINQARPQACKCGGDAMLVENSATTGMSFTGYGTGTAAITIIRYTDRKK